MRSFPQTCRAGNNLTAEGGRKGTSPACGGAKSPLTGPRCTPGVSWSLSFTTFTPVGYGVRAQARTVLYTPRILNYNFFFLGGGAAWTCATVL